MGSTDKLTKKQRKSLAFRERKGKGKAADVEDNDVPIAEDQDLAEIHTLEAEEDGEKTNEKPSQVVEGKKRKRVGEEDNGAGGEQQKPKAKKRKGRDGEGVGAEADSVKRGEGEGEGEEEKLSKESKKDRQQRFILFVGNLKYATTKEAVQEHFSSCDPPPSVRLMTPKPSPGKTTAKSKGFAFLEFPNKVGLQQALKLHHSELQGRQINVELTAGGGGKSEGRLTKLKERNKELHEQRKKHLQKQKKSKDGVEGEVEMGRPQRYSATSGVDQVPVTKRTWTVGDTTEESTKKKRGSKHKKLPRALGTGVNAIPVG